MWMEVYYERKAQTLQSAVWMFINRVVEIIHYLAPFFHKRWR